MGLELPRRRCLQLFGTLSLGVGDLTASGAAETATQTTDEEWTQFQYDAANSGHNPDTIGPKTDIGQRWLFDPDQVANAPTYADRTVFVGTGRLGDPGKVYAIDAATKDVRWSFEAGGSVRSGPAVADGSVYVGRYGGDGGVYAIDAETGDQEWYTDTGYIQASATVAGDHVYVGSNDDTFYALTADTGEISWQVDSTNGEGFAVTPAVVDGTVYTGDYGGTVYALDADSGDIQWRFETDVAIRASPTVTDGTVYTGSYDRDTDADRTYGRAFALDAATGDERWSYDASTRTSPIVIDGIVYIGGWETTVHALDIATGDRQWKYRPGFSVDGMTFVDGLLYVTGGPYLHVVDPGARDEIEVFRGDHYTTTPSSPISVDGTTYVGTRSGLQALSEGFADEGTAEAPEIDSGSVRLSTTAVEAGGQPPEISVRVDNADGVLVQAEYGSEIETVSLDPEEGNRWSGTVDLNASLPPGTWVDLTVLVPEADGDPAQLGEFQSSTRLYVLEEPSLGYYVFEEVLDVAVLVGRFQGADPVADRLPSYPQWRYIREHDLNSYLGSERGTMGAVGMRLAYEDDDGDGYELPESRAHYENIGDRIRDAFKTDGIGTYLEDLRNAAGLEVSGLNDEYDFWFGTHPGLDSVGEPQGVNGMYLPWDNGAYAPGLVEFEDTFRTWIHEFGHAYGLPHTSMTNACVMGDADGATRRRGGDVHPVPPNSLCLRMADTLGMDLRMSPLAELSQWEPPDEFEDWLDATAISLGFTRSVTTIPALNAYERDDRSKFYEHQARRLTVRFVPEYREDLQGVSWEVEDGEEIPVADWGDGDGGVAINRIESVSDVAESHTVVTNNDDDYRRYLTEPGDRLWSPLGGGDPPGVSFELRGFSEEDGTSVAELEITREIQDTSTTEVVLDTSVRIGEAVGGAIGQQSVSRELLAIGLRVEDAQGRVVGVTESGEYVNEIPEAVASGRRPGGTEWIRIPDDLDINVTVDGGDLERFVDAVDVSAEELGLQANYELSVTDYESDATVVEENGTVRVEGATSLTTDGTLPPGEEQTYNRNQLAENATDSESSGAPSNSDGTDESLPEESDSDEGFPLLAADLIAKFGIVLAGGVAAGAGLLYRLWTSNEGQHSE